jgi:DNA-binding NarL/FixJ family response regulator
MGVQGFVSKDRAGKMLVEAVNALLQHKTYFPLDALTGTG